MVCEAAAARGAAFDRENTMGAGGVVKAARRTEEENIPRSRHASPVP